MKQRRKQATSQKLWRGQLKWISRLLLAAFALLLLAAMYLGLAGEATAVAQRLRSLNMAKIELQESIFTQQSRLAQFQSAAQLKPRMEDMGFTRYNHTDVIYVAVPGYQPPAAFRLADPASAQGFAQPIIRSSFTESLWDWLNHQVDQWSMNARSRQ